MLAGPINDYELPSTSSLLREPERDRYGYHPHPYQQYKLSVFGPPRLKTVRGHEIKPMPVPIEALHVFFLTRF